MALKTSTELRIRSIVISSFLEVRKEQFGAYDKRGAVSEICWSPSRIGEPCYWAAFRVLINPNFART